MYKKLTKNQIMFGLLLVIAGYYIYKRYNRGADEYAGVSCEGSDLTPEQVDECLEKEVVCEEEEDPEVARQCRQDIINEIKGNK